MIRRRTRIKICGVTRVEDALTAAAAGADAVGMIRHAPAGRCVSVEAARGLVAALPAFVTPVAVYAGEDPEQVAEDANAIGPGVVVQLHRGATPDAVAALAPRAVFVGIQVTAEAGDATLAQWRTAARLLPNLKALLLESPGQSGGEGVENDWALLARLAQTGALDGLPPLVMAGGLTPGNVERVVRDLRPWGVDVSSGVEGPARGEKSPERVTAFVRAVRAADDD